MKMGKIKIQYLLLAGVLIYGLYYYLAGAGSVKMNSSKAVEMVMEQVGKVDADKYQILEIAWSEGEKLSNNPRYVDVTLLDKEGKRYSQQFDIFDDKELSFSEMPDFASRFPGYKAPEYKPLTLPDDVNAEKVVREMESAIGQLPEEFVFQSVYQYNIERNSDTGELERRLVLRVTKKGESKEVDGRHITTTYYEIPFEIASDGSVTPENDDE